MSATARGDDLYLVTALRTGSGYIKFYNYDDDKEFEVSVRIVPTGSDEQLAEPELWAANADYVLRRASQGYVEDLVLSNEVASATSSNSAVFEASADGRGVRIDSVGVGVAELSVTDVYGNAMTFTVEVDRVLG